LFPDLLLSKLFLLRSKVMNIASLKPKSECLDLLPDWQKLVWLSDEQLSQYDIAAINLAVAVGLPESESMDVALCLSTLDQWAKNVDDYTTRLLPQFHRKGRPGEINTEAYFRAVALVTVLQRDKGVRYNPFKKSSDAPFDTADLFIHGIIQGNGGTCATMPVVYVAVGRRLGYPLKLVSTQGSISDRATYSLAGMIDTLVSSLTLKRQTLASRCHPMLTTERESMR
jgi:hypothetical protein